MSQIKHSDEHANPALGVVQDFGLCINAFLADAVALGMADGNHLDDERIAIGPMVI